MRVSNRSGMLAKRQVISGSRSISAGWRLFVPNGCRARSRAYGPVSPSGASCSARPGHGHLAEQGPVVLRDRHIDDPRRLGKMWWQRPLRLPEVLGLHVRSTGLIVAEDRKSTRLNSSHEWSSYAVF